MPVQGDPSTERSERTESLYGDTPGCREEDTQVLESPGSAEIHPSSSLDKLKLDHLFLLLLTYIII